MKWHQGEVIQRFLRSAQGCFQDLGCALDDLHQVVVHGAGHVEDERQSRCPLRDRLCCGCRDPSVLPGAKSHWQREVQPQQSAAHLRVKMLHRESSCSGQSVGQRASRNNAGHIGLSETGLGLRLCLQILVHLLLQPLAPLWTKGMQLQVSSACCLQSQESFQPCHTKTTSQLGSLPGAKYPMLDSMLWLDKTVLVTSGDLARK